MQAGWLGLEQVREAQAEVGIQRAFSSEVYASHAVSIVAFVSMVAILLTDLAAGRSPQAAAIAWLVDNAVTCVSWAIAWVQIAVAHMQRARR